MKKLLRTIIPLIILGALIYQYRSTLREQFLPLFENIKSQIFPQVPCKEPIPYNLGTFDKQFNISQKYFLSALADAEAIWEKSQGDYQGKNLFVYAPANSDSSVLKVNLIYDYRQQATSKLASLGIVVKDNRASYDMLKAKFTALKIDYNKQKSAFSAQVDAFNKKQDAYQTEVNFWNKKGGAPKNEYDRLQATQATLEAESKALQTTQNHINSMADEINALVVVLNRLVGTLNLSVEKFNTTNVSRGETFEEGVYVSDGLNREIDIYEFSSREKLVRVLAHELGHALNLDHVDDPKAIMYKLNQGTNTSLTKTDLDALKAKCGII